MRFRYHKFGAFVFGAFLLAALPVVGEAEEGSSKIPDLAIHSKLPLGFEVNQGQIDPQVKFLTRGPGYNLLLTPSEAALVTSGSARRMLRMKLVGSNPHAQLIGQDELPGKVNYYVGNDASKWREGVPTYARVQYRNVYPGVDAVFYGNQGELEHDFVIAPFADSKRIRLQFEGHTELRLDSNGDLVLRMAGTDEIRLMKPKLYQEVDGKRHEVAGSYVLKGKGTAGFSVGTYDPSRLLVIDPVVTYATRLGGTHASGGAAAAAEAGAAVAVDPAGNAYVTGTTNSYDFPGVGSAIGDSVCFHPSEQFCEFGFVTKIDPTGSVILYSSIFGEGGQVAASGTGIAVDQQGNAYITGSTLGGMPTKNALQPLFAGGSDAFVFKLDSAGHLVFCTYLGGSGDESAGDIAADPFGNIVVTGYTSSPNFPVANAFQSTHFGSTRSDYDAFVTKLTGDGSAMVFSTYLGGSSLDFGGGVAADTAGNVYATGTTFSFGFPTTPGAFQSTSTGANAVAYVSKFDPVGNVVYSTLLGGTSSIAGQFSGAGAIAVDGAGSAYVTGRTSDPSFPTSPGAFQQTFGQTFVTKFNASGSGLVYSTFLGGSNGNDGGSGLAVNSAGEAYVGGLTSSSDFPTIDAFRQAPPCQLAACTDGFVAKLNAAGSGLIYSSYVGGLVSGLFFDSSRSVYLTGSRGFATPNAAQTSYGNAFLAKITETGNQAPVARATAATQPTECSSSHGTAVRLDGSASSDPDNDQISFEWKDSSDHVVGTSAVVQVTVPLGTSNFTLTVNDGNGGTASANVAVRVVDTAAPSLILSTDTMTLVLPTASASGMAASVNGIATASDTCDAAPVVSSLAPVQFAVGITHVPLTATDASGNSTTRDLIVHVAYNFNGSTIPQNIGGSAPIRFALTAADGSRIDNATANIEVFVLQSGGVLQPVSVLSSGGANSGTLFRFDPVNQQYIYNLSTKNYPPGAYVLRVRINDQTSYDTPISIR